MPHPMWSRIWDAIRRGQNELSILRYHRHIHDILKVYSYSKPRYIAVDVAVVVGGFLVSGRIQTNDGWTLESNIPQGCVNIVNCDHKIYTSYIFRVPPDAHQCEIAISITTIREW